LNYTRAVLSRAAGEGGRECACRSAPSLTLPRCAERGSRDARFISRAA